MTIFTEVRTGQSVLEDIQAPLSDVLGVTAEEAWIRSPTSSAGRMLELRGANQGLPLGVGSDTGEIEFSAPSPMLSADDARTRIKEEGLSLSVPDAGIRRDALDILIQRKSEERKRKDIMARGPSGIGPAVAGFGTALAVSVLDPLNVASAFIPVVGPARYGRMIEQAGGALGRMGVRARVGAVEGAVGAAVVEPIVLAAASQEQADYGLNDTLLNIALGTALGGGLHVGIGAASDALARRAAWQQAKAVDPLPRILEQVPPEAREAALRVAVSQAMTGRAVDVEPVIRAYHGSPHDFDRFDMSRIGTGEGAQAYGHGLYFAESEGVARSYRDALTDYPGTPEGLASQALRATAATRTGLDRAAAIDALVARLGHLERMGSDDSTRARMRDAISLLRSDDWEPNLGRMYEVAIKADKDKFLDWDKPLSEQHPLVRQFFENRQSAAPVYPDTPGAHLLGFISSDKRIAAKVMREAGIPGIKYLDQGSRSVGEGSRNYVVFDDKLVDIVAKDGHPIRQPDMAAEAQKSFAPENARMVDMDAVRIGDEKIKTAVANDDTAAIEQSLADVTEDVQALAKAIGDDELMARELQPFDELTETAEAYGRAVMAAANCGLRRGSA